MPCGINRRCLDSRSDTTWKLMTHAINRTWRYRLKRRCCVVPYTMWQVRYVADRGCEWHFLSAIGPGADPKSIWRRCALDPEPIPQASKHSARSCLGWDLAASDWVVPRLGLSRIRLLAVGRAARHRHGRGRPREKRQGGRGRQRVMKETGGGMALAHGEAGAGYRPFPLQDEADDHVPMRSADEDASSAAAVG